MVEQVVARPRIEQFEGLSRHHRAELMVTRPILQAVQENYGAERGWEVCGMATILEGRFLSALIGAPLKQGNGTRERRFEYKIAIKEDNDHSLLFYYPGKLGQVYVYDMVGSYIWDGFNPTFLDNSPDVVLYDMHPKGHGKPTSVWKSLRDEQGYYPFTDELAKERGLYLRKGTVRTEAERDDMLAIMHSDEVFQDTVIYPSTGERVDVSNWWGMRLRNTGVRALELMALDEIERTRVLQTIPQFRSKLVAAHI